MLKPLFSNSDLDRWMDKFHENAEAALHEKLKETGEMFVKLARESGTYQDQTGNLRSSIGYVIVKNGTVLDKNFAQAGKGTDPSKGAPAAEKLAARIALGMPGFVLIGVAGMNYSAAVEAKGFEVISNTSLQVEKYLVDSIQIVLNET